VTADYPAHRVADVVLRDGSTVRIRPARPDDRDRVEDYLIGLSPRTRHLRFMSASVNVRDVANRAVDVDYRDHVTLIALLGGDRGRVVGGCQYLRMDGDRAEVSFSVADEMQGKGIGSILLEHLAEAAVENGVSTFYAEVLPENHMMIQVFRDSGFDLSIRATPGAIEVEFPTSLTEQALERYEEREIQAAINAMRILLAPSSIAVIGASRDVTSIGGRLFRNLLTTGFQGPVYPVNPSADVVQGVPAYPSISEVPRAVDVAFVAVAAPLVADVARECGSKGVRGLVVISSGFAEVGGEGPARQAELIELCRANGMRLIGPNCMGVINTLPSVSMNGTFATVWPPAGRVGFMSQSGALGIAVMDYATRLGLGLSTFVSVGNQADVSASDLVSYWDADENTDVILLYLESFANAHRFARLARRVGRRKPIVAVKSGRSSAGARASASHTGALLAASDVTVDALFRQTGIIRTDTLEEMFDVATLLANQPPPKGDRVGIVTNAGGLGILCADTCEANGLVVPPLSDGTTNELRSFLPPEASAANPVDMIASAAGDDYRRAIATVAADPDIDALIVIYIPPLEAQAPEIARAIVDAIREIDGRIPVLTTFMSAKGLPEELHAPGVDIPSFAFPEQAAIALAHAAQYGTWRLKPQGEEPHFPDVRSDEATSVLAEALGDDGGGWLSPSQVEHVLSCYGIPVAHLHEVSTPEEAGQAAAEVHGRVALKAAGKDIVHKTEMGAVRVGLLGAAEVRREAEAMAERVASHGATLEGFVVQPMVEEGVEMLVGVVKDRVFGPVVACGAGGTAVELVRDVAVRVTPLTDADAAEMVRSLATFPLLEGYRGAPKADVGALEELLLRVGALVEDHPEIAEMDCNPVMVQRRGATVIDARMRVEPAGPRAPRASAAGG
jgi:acetyl coenzyme A synthetase (ADP forming)-like protein